MSEYRKIERLVEFVEGRIADLKEMANIAENENEINSDLQYMEGCIDAYEIVLAKLVDEDE